jgi:hypothetical protein
MSWIRKLLGLHSREYRGDDFSVRIEPIEREVVSIIHTRRGTSLHLDGERIGKKWSGVHVLVPQSGEADQVLQIVHDLKTAFEAMGYGYVIARKIGVDIVPEAERQAAIAELSEMGFEIEVLPDRKIRQTWRTGAPRQDIETIRRTIPRMMMLIRAVHGSRERFEILASSKEFQSVVSENQSP